MPRLTVVSSLTIFVKMLWKLCGNDLNRIPKKLLRAEFTGMRRDLCHHLALRVATLDVEE